MQYGSCFVTQSRVFFAIFVTINQFWTCVSYLIVAEEEDEADNLLEDGLHLLVAALADGRQRHQPGVAVLPVG